MVDLHDVMQNQMIDIYLKDLKFTCAHGVYKEEALTRGLFIVNLAVTYEPNTVPVKQIAETIDYTSLYALVKKRMQTQTPLLETLVTEIALEILQKFELVQKVNITIDKMNAPIENFEGIVGVGYTIKRNEV